MLPLQPVLPLQCPAPLAPPPLLAPAPPASWPASSRLLSDPVPAIFRYNVLKILRHLFRWAPSAAIGDDYEKKITNGVIGIQDPTEIGTMVLWH